MLKNIQKSSLKTLDELSAMASVAEKVADLEAKESDGRNDDNAMVSAAASSNPPTSDQLQDEEMKYIGDNEVFPTKLHDLVFVEAIVSKC